MDKIKISKKDITTLISESVNNTVGSIEKAKPGKKLKKLIGKSAKKIAGKVTNQLKRDAKKAKRVAKSLTVVEDVLNGKEKKPKKAKKTKTQKSA
jgi:hypothetical protein